MTYRAFWQPLTAVYQQAESKAVAQLVMEKVFGLSHAGILCGGVEQIDEKLLRTLQERLLTGEPVQYVIGKADFCGREFHVEPGVLIPRPETQWMCDYVTSRWQQSPHGGAILDMGTGSGCIACTIALDLADPAVQVEAWDISDEALRIASINARLLGAKVTLARQDMLCPPNDGECWDVIVSNPPYICQHEQEAMELNVLDFEPRMALFVPDDNPLLYYQSIAGYARQALKPGGYLLTEVNEHLAADVAHLFGANGLQGVGIHKDIFGKDRFTIGWKEKK